MDTEADKQMKTRISGLTKKMDDSHTDRHKDRQRDGWNDKIMGRKVDE